MSKRQQPTWHVPTGTFRTGLQVENSLTSHRDEFIPEDGKQVKWYICGPTVYDSSHLGHARTYLSFDIIRRILEGYFGYDVQVCMNITDVDDKIIIKARKNHLFAEYAQKIPTLSNGPELEKSKTQMMEALEESLASYHTKIAKLESQVIAGARTAKDAEPEINLAKEKSTKAAQIKSTLSNELPNISTGNALAVHLPDLKDALSDYLDARLGSSLPTELLNELTKRHSRQYEKEYMEDMKRLGIKTPDVLTRVSEYIPEIIEMVEKIIKNGYAYESQGSIYFDVAAFDKVENHFYAKLKPSAYGNTELLAEGEGNLTTTGEKRSPNDFALWKKSKAGEPVWDSPWGAGRPGWHIECSAMAGKVLGGKLDIHAGGCDLKFPHHDNELAQSEAYFDSKQWVNYFLHTGHLDIDGLKMSKSLKNFITIGEMLSDHPARQVRFLFLLQQWDSGMNFQRTDTMKEVLVKEKHLKEFFAAVEHILLERLQDSNLDKVEAWSDRDSEFQAQVVATQKAVHASLCANFDTPSVMRSLDNLVTSANIYLSKNPDRKAFLLKKAAVYITSILRTFGLIEGNQEIGFGNMELGEQNSNTNALRPVVSALVEFRKQVRNVAKDVSGDAKRTLLTITDALRDETMPPLGIRIGDDGEVPFVFEDPAVLAKERAAKIAAEEAARKNKIIALIARKEKERDNLFAAKEAPAELIKRKFKVVVTDINSIPSKDESGADISKSASKNIAKEWAAQTKAHTKYTHDIAANPNLLQNLLAEIEAAKTQLRNNAASSSSSQ